MPALELDEATLYYETHGDEGPWLTLVHGGLCSSETWADAVTSLAPQCRVITYDLRGYGRSTTAEVDASPRRAARDLLSIWDHLGVEQGFVLGFSVGGMIAQAVAAENPSRLQGLVLVSTTARLDDDAQAMYRRRADELAADGLAPHLDALIERAFSRGFREEQPEVVAAYGRRVLEAPVPIMAASLRAIAEFDGTEQLAKIVCPVVVLAGAADAGMHAAYQHELQRRLPNAALALLPEVGHTLHVEALPAFSHIVGDFVSSGAEEMDVFRTSGAPEPRSV